jgi:hypothetical protein
MCIILCLAVSTRFRLKILNFPPSSSLFSIWYDTEVAYRPQALCVCAVSYDIELLRHPASGHCICQWLRFILDPRGILHIFL